MRIFFIFIYFITFVCLISSAKVVSFQKITVSWKENKVSKREKVSLAEIARQQHPDEMGDF